MKIKLISKKDLLFIHFLAKKLTSNLSYFELHCGKHRGFILKTVIKSETMFPFGFRSINVGQGLGKYNFDLAASGRIERANDNCGVSLGLDQVHLYYCSANVIQLHCFYNSFPCQIQPSITSWFVNSKAHSFWVQLRPGLCSCSKNGHAKILAGHSSSWVNSVRKPLPHSDPHWGFNEMRHLCIMEMNCSRRREWCYWDFVSIIVFFSRELLSHC